MQRLLRIALPVVALATMNGFATSPAQAHADVCTGMFVLTSSAGLGATIDTPVLSDFIISPTTASCASGTPFSAFGTFFGDCTVATGSGFTTTGHAFTFQLAGAFVLSGDATGSLAVIDDPTSDGSCFSGSASGFFLTGAVVLAH